MTEPKAPSTRELLATIGLTVGKHDVKRGVSQLLRDDGELFAELSAEQASVAFRCGILVRELAFKGPLKQWVLEEIYELVQARRSPAPNPWPEVTS